MSIVLIAANQSLATAVAGFFRQEGREVDITVLDSPFSERSIAPSADMAILLQPDRSAGTIGEEVVRVRTALDSQRPLLVCCPQPSFADRQVLLDCGATAVISPASWGADSVADRVLAEYFLDYPDRAKVCGEMIGATHVMTEVYRQIAVLAPLDEPVLIHGETGTGKELAARAIHRESARPDPFLPVSCAELSTELLGSELFGHERGAFTNAVQQRRGLLVAAQHGTAFLDEIGELDLQAQAKLLRAIEDRQVRPVGSNRWETVHARLVLATNRDLDEEAQIGRFRPDLLERIRGFTLELPPLRERRADIALLAHHFVEESSKHYKKALRVPPGAFDCLFLYDWVGNVRELRAAVRKASAFADQQDNINVLLLQEAVRGRRIRPKQHSIQFDPSSDTWRDVQKRAQAAYFRSLLSVTGGNREIAAKLSGLGRTQFYEKLKEIE